MSTTICTLYEKEYHYGLGALINSLSLSGFQGNIWAARRDHSIPFWFKQEQSTEPHPTYRPTPDIKVQLIQRNPPHHLSHDKALWIQEVLHKYDPQADKLFYFDCDIIVLRKWKLFEDWVSSGVALCEDIARIPVSHPLRKSWIPFLPEELRTESYRDLPYFNAGFLGMRRDHLDLIQRWAMIQGKMLGRVDSKQSLQQGDFFDPLHLPDQHALNLACQTGSTPLCWTGRDGMGLEPGLPYMSHSVSTPKPWDTCYTKHLLKGRVPNWNHGHYWKHCLDPLRLYSRLYSTMKHLEYQLARSISLILLGRSHRFW
jgi:lipopolysaccharide biosynthesis glycosyltransferase